MAGAGKKTPPKYLSSFGRRRVRGLKASEVTLYEELLPRLRVMLPEKGTISFTELFPSAKKTYLEIGFGAGEHLVARAQESKDAGFIGCEVFMNGVGACLRHIEKEALTNVRLFTEDARLLLEKLPSGSVEGVYILFPDPWPKARHNKRRIINPETLAMLARVVKPGGFLQLATDDVSYLRWMLVQMAGQQVFQWQAKGPEAWQSPPPGHVLTRYETKARKNNRKPHFLRYFREKERVAKAD